MKSIVICDECKGAGKYLVHNAYAPELKEYVVCEFCEGEEVDTNLFSASKKNLRPN